MNKQELITAIAEKTGMTKADTARQLDATIEVITDATASGDGVQLVGFMTLKATKRAARKGHNPATGKPVDIAEKMVPKFTAGAKLKDAVAAGQKNAKKK